MFKKLNISAFSILLIVLNSFESDCGQMVNLGRRSMRKIQLPLNYDKDRRPAQFGDAVHVEFEIHVQAINPIKASDMDFRMELTLLQRWVDTRLSFSDEYFLESDRIVLPNELIDHIWHPDPFIINAKSTDIGQLTQKLINVYIYKNMTVVYSVNLFATIACAMQFQYFPYDYQLCPTVIESFSYDESLVKYTWSNNSAFTINPKLRLLQFVVTYPLRYEACSIHRIKEAKNFSQLVAYFRFDRLLGNHLIQTFAPGCLVVSLTWFSFWLELDAISARVSLLVTAMLTLMTQFNGLKLDFPPVAYIKAVDIWMAGCMVFTFAALGEFVIVKVIYSLTEDERVKASLDALKNNKEDDSLSNSSDLFPQINSAPLTQRSAISPKGAYNGIFSQSNYRLMNGAKDNNSMKNGVIEDISNSLIKSYEEAKLSSAVKPRKHGSVALTMPDLTYVFYGKFGLPLAWSSSNGEKKHILWRNIDYISRWIFPISFLLGVGVYWLVLFIHSRLNSPSLMPPSYCR